MKKSHKKKEIYLHISKDGNDTNNGLTRKTAKYSITAAVKVAKKHQTIIIHGSYKSIY
jgi:hypothetical protein